jgi:hypothetical protein
MRDIGPYIYPLIFVVLVLLNYFAQRIARWQKQQQVPPNEAAKAQQEALEQRAEEVKRRREELKRARAEAQRQLEKPTPRVQRAADQIKRARLGTEASSLEVLEPRARVRRAEAPTVPTIIAPRRPDVRALLAGRRNLRDAIVIMTVLGPCRAQQPPEVG